MAVLMVARDRVGAAISGIVGQASRCMIAT